MACGCGRSPDGCRGWHSLSEDEYKVEYEAFLQEKEGNYKKRRRTKNNMTKKKKNEGRKRE